MQHLDAEPIERAAALLDAARRAARVLEGLPRELQPRSLAEAYAIQDRVVALSGAPVEGWFVGCSNAVEQRQLNLQSPLQRPPAGERAAPVTCPVLRVRRRLQPPAEVEFAFRLRVDLSARARPYANEEVMEAVASVHPAIEVKTSRLQDWTRQPALDLIADNGVDGALVYGAAAGEWRTLDLCTLAVRLAGSGGGFAPGSASTRWAAPCRR